MAVYYFKARDANNRIVKGQAKAGSKQDLERKLMIRKQFVLLSASTTKETKEKASIFGVKTKNLVISTRQLAFLINASVPVVQALRTVAQNTGDAGLKDIMTKVANNVESGSSFSEALKAYPTVFDEVYINMVAAGESGGSLDVMLNRLAVYIEKTHSIISKIRSGMIYPGFVSFVAGAIVIGLLVFLVPKFEEIFADAEQDLPALTQKTVNLSHFIRDHYIIFVGIILAVIVGGAIFMTTRMGKLTIEAISMKMPVLGDLLTKYRVARFSRTLSSMLASGSNLTEALQLGARATGGIFFKESIKRMIKMVESGYSMAKAISREKVFPGLVKNMILVGEQTGNMTEVLNKVADFYEEQVDVSVENLLKLVEPALLVGVAVIIGFIVISMYLPIFKMGQLVGG